VGPFEWPPPASKAGASAEFRHLRKKMSQEASVARDLRFPALFVSTMVAANHSRILSDLGSFLVVQQRLFFSDEAIKPTLSLRLPRGGRRAVTQNAAGIVRDTEPSGHSSLKV
jgi:hypothetical protein